MEDSKLEAIKAKMTAKQRKDMSELLSNELKRRQENKSSAASMAASALSGQKSKVRSSSITGVSSREDVADIYAQLEQKKKEIAERKANGGVSVSLSGIKPSVPLFSKPSFFKLPQSPKRALILTGVFAFAVLKVLSTTGVVKASIDKSSSFKDTVSQLAMERSEKIDAPVEKHVNVNPVMPTLLADSSITPIEKNILTDLDKRRVELDRRRQNLEQREQALKEQEKEVLANLSELRSLTRKIQEHQKHKDQQYEARMEQLANVYSSMAPQEAAPIVAKLDDEIGLALLQRMPGKRMGQILSMMNADRAIELTRLLTDEDLR